MFNLQGRRVVVVGYGPVGRRKAAAASAAGTNVIVVDPTPSIIEFTHCDIRSDRECEHFSLFFEVRVGQTELLHCGN